LGVKTERSRAMRIAGSIITLICGILVIVGVFLAWAESCFMGFCVSISGWDGISVGVTDAFDAFMVFIGGIVMAVFALPTLIVSLAAKGGRAAVVTLSIFAILGALIAVGGGAWFMIDAATNDMLSLVSYGFYISFAAAIIGFVFAILTAAFSKGRQDW
jgi:hypothetical protein